MTLKNTAIVTHTGSDIGLEEAGRLSVEMVCDMVLFGDKAYRNMADITAQEFYEKTENIRELPTSSQPATGEFAEAIQRAGENAREVLCLMITSKMSGCYNGAVAAAGLVKEQGFEKPVFVYDTGQCSHGMAHMVRKAAAMAEEGCSAKEIIDEMDSLRDRIGVYFVLDSLKNAQKGGRVGAIKMLAADILGIKPLLVFRDGLVKDIGIARSFQEGLSSVFRKLEEEGDLSEPITVFHGATPERAQALKDMITKKYPDAHLRTEFVGPVIGIYAGSGSCGIAFTKKK